jgi:RecA/RadA recombinase
MRQPSGLGIQSRDRARNIRSVQVDQGAQVVRRKEGAGQMIRAARKTQESQFVGCLMAMSQNVAHVNIAMIVQHYSFNMIEQWESSSEALAKTMLAMVRSEMICACGEISGIQDAHVVSDHRASVFQLVENKTEPPINIIFWP